MSVKDKLQIYLITYNSQLLNIVVNNLQEG